jgi:uncharacterized membrane protein
MEKYERIAGQGGFMCGAMAIPFIEWCADNARAGNPVAFALRGAEAVAHTAAMMARLHPERFGPLAEWKALHINKKMASIYKYARAGNNDCRREWGNICKYFTDNGLGGAWTMIDTGMSGNMAAGLGEACPTQALLFSHSEPDTNDVRGFMNAPGHAEELDKPIAYAGDRIRIYHQLTDFMDAMPHTHDVVDGCCEDGRPVLIPNQNIGGAIALRAAYIHGLDRAVHAWTAGKLPKINTCLRELFSGNAIGKYINILGGR